MTRDAVKTSQFDLPLIAFSSRGEALFGLFVRKPTFVRTKRGLEAGLSKNRLILIIPLAEYEQGAPYERTTNFYVLYRSVHTTAPFK